MIDLKRLVINGRMGRKYNEFVVLTRQVIVLQIWVSILPPPQFINDVFLPNFTELSV